MRLIDEIKRVFRSEDGSITPEMLERIKNSEKTMRLIDALPDETYSPWYRLFLRSHGDVEEGIFSLAMERAEKFGNLSNFLSDFCGEKYIDTVCERALPIATTSVIFRKIAKHSRSPKIKKRGINGALTTAKTPKDCSDAICILSRMKIEDEKFIEESIKKAIERAVILAGNLYEIYGFRRSVCCPCFDSLNQEEQKRLEPIDFMLAINLANSSLAFARKGLLRERVNLCQKRDGKMDETLDALLTSILQFGRYEYLRNQVPDGQRRLKLNKAN